MDGFLKNYNKMFFVELHSFPSSD